MPHGRKKITILGAGMAGLVAAHDGTLEFLADQFATEGP
jgi:hypothetical protein